jgi:hypothetical protein
MQKLLDWFMNPGVFLVLMLVLGVASVGLAGEGGEGPALSQASSILSAAFLIGSVLLHVHRPR